jgi:hypothetical protein
LSCNDHHTSGTQQHPLTILQSPNVRTFFESTANQQGVTNAATETGIAQSIVITTTNTNTTTNTDRGSIRRPHDPPQFSTTMHQNISDPSSSSGATTTEANMTMISSTDNTKPSVGAMTLDRKNRSTKNHTMTMTTKGAMISPMRTTTGTTMNNSSRKPVTTAINTVPYANCNARLFLQGGAPMIVPPKGQHVASTTTTPSTNHQSNNNDNDGCCTWGCHYHYQNFTSTYQRR